MKKNNVRNLRRSRNLSQTDMAKELNIPQTRISDWENGRAKITDEEAETLADYFGVSTAYVVGDSKDKWGQQDLLSYIVGDDEENSKDYRAQDFMEMELLECYRYLDGKGKSYLMQTVKMLEKFYGMKE